MVNQILQGFWPLRSSHERSLLKKRVPVSLPSLSTKILISISPASMLPFFLSGLRQLFHHSLCSVGSKLPEMQQPCSHSVMGRVADHGEGTTDSLEPPLNQTQTLHTLGTQ